MPISDQAYDLIGEKAFADKQVFEKVYYDQIRKFLVEWTSMTCIGKHITFSCLRHTYATLQLSHGTDIFIPYLKC